MSIALMFGGGGSGPTSGVTSVSGTANQIASTGGTTPVLSITNPLITPGSIQSTGSNAGGVALTQGTANSIPANSFLVEAPTGISTGFGWIAPAAENASSGYVKAGAASSHKSTLSVGAIAAADVPAETMTVTTSTPVTVSTTLNSGYYVNEHATAATAITFNLPTAAAGKEFCFANGNNGSAANTGALTIATSAAGQFIIFTDGTLSATGGNVASGGAGGDAACVVGVDATHWLVYINRGTWTKN